MFTLQQPSDVCHIAMQMRNEPAGKELKEALEFYVTDMYASVKTRVMELKDFDRIHVKPGQSVSVSFELTPYQLSLLNDKMDCVVEPRRFKISVGGVSPEFVNGAKRGDGIHYELDPQQSKLIPFQLDDHDGDISFVTKYRIVHL